MIEQREHVESSLAKRERARRVRRAPVSAQVGHDDSEAVRIAASEDELPIAADAGAAVQEQQRVATAALFVVELKTVDVDDHGYAPVTFRSRRRAPGFSFHGPAPEPLGDPLRRDVRGFVEKRGIGRFDLIP